MASEDTKWEQQLITAPISGHAYNSDLSQVVVSDNSNIFCIYKFDNAKKKYVKEMALKKHIERVKSVDWAPKTNRIVTCSGDRNAYVWNLEVETGQWKPTLVLLRIDRAATYVRWSPQEDRFAVGSGARILSICHYDEENDWWVSKHIKKPIRSTILCVDWHPNNYLIASGTCDFKCRVFSAALKELQDKPEVSSWMPKLSKFGTLLAEFDVSEGWVHGVKFSPEGDKLCWVSHDCTVNVVDMQSQEKVLRCVCSSLPLTTVIFLSETSLVCAGHDNMPSLYNIVGGEEVVLGAKLDVKQQKSSAGLSAMARFKQLDKTGDGQKESKLDSTHQNAIVELRVTKVEGGKVKQFSSAGVDGKIVLWNTDVLAATIAGLKI